MTFGVGDAKEIQIWEAKVERDGTPIKAFYEYVFFNILIVYALLAHLRKGKKVDPAILFLVLKIKWLEMFFF